MITIAGLAQLGSASQAGPFTPTACKAVLMSPLCPLYIHTQSSELATAGISEGRKNSVRYSPSPLTRELSNSASPSDTNSPSPTEPSAKYAVLYRPLQNNGSASKSA